MWCPEVGEVPAEDKCGTRFMLIGAETAAPDTHESKGLCGLFGTVPAGDQLLTGLCKFMAELATTGLEKAALEQQ